MPSEVLNTLHVQTQGASLHLESESIKIVLPEDPVAHRLPLRRIESIALYGHVTCSTELITQCAADGRPITYLSRAGRYIARIEGPQHNTVLLRHAQHLAHEDSDKRLAIARALVAGKLHNSRQLLIRTARDTIGARQHHLREASADIADLITAIAGARTIEQLLGHEGAAARAYFKTLPHLLAPNIDLPTPEHRTRRPALDPVNALLSFAYGLVRSMVHGACEHVGFDPHIGFLHATRPGKPALALDLMEELRPVIADRFALTLINRKKITAKDFETLPGGAVNLTDSGRATVLTAWHESRADTRDHLMLGRPTPTAVIPAIQARILARHLRGELPAYLPWTPK